MEVLEAQRVEAQEEERLYIDDEKFASLQEEVEEKTREYIKWKFRLRQTDSSSMRVIFAVLALQAEARETAEEA